MRNVGHPINGYLSEAANGLTACDISNANPVRSSDAPAKKAGGLVVAQ
jgi:hypothetical protein